MPSDVSRRQQLVELLLVGFAVNAVERRACGVFLELMCHGDVSHDHAFFDEVCERRFELAGSIARTRSAESITNSASAASKSKAPRLARALVESMVGRRPAP